MDEKIIILIGDSILDNFYYLCDKKHDLKYELSNLDYSVNNYAVDESKLENIIYGIIPANKYVKNRSYPYPTDNNGKVCPLKLIIKNDIKNTMAVICIGGNDLRKALKETLFGIDILFNKVFTSEYVNNYEYVTREIMKWSNKTILISVYFPYLGHKSSYRKYDGLIEPLIIEWRNYIYNVAHNNNIPVLDLSKTFNKIDRSHYGSSIIEPSDISNKCIAHCLNIIYNNYKGFGIYFAPDCDISRFTHQYIL